MKKCGNCLFHDEDRWGAVKCSSTNEYVGSEDVCKDWEDEKIVIDTIMNPSWNETPEQILDLKRQVVMFMRYGRKDEAD